MAETNIILPTSLLPGRRGMSSIVAKGNGATFERLVCFRTAADCKVNAFPVLVMTVVPVFGFRVNGVRFLFPYPLTKPASAAGLAGGGPATIIGPWAAFTMR